VQTDRDALDQELKLTQGRYQIQNRELADARTRFSACTTQSREHEEEIATLDELTRSLQTRLRSERQAHTALQAELQAAVDQTERLEEIARARGVRDGLEAVLAEELKSLGSTRTSAENLIAQLKDALTQATAEILVYMRHQHEQQEQQNESGAGSRFSSSSSGEEGETQLFA
jgi:chromosome segregation ATPase